MGFKFNALTGQLDLSNSAGSGGTVTEVNGQVGPVVTLDAGDVGADPAGTAQDLFDQIGAKYVRTTRFEIINSGTSGTVTLPADAEVILDDFGGTVDAVISQVSGGKPDIQSAKTSGGAIVATSFDTDGNWSFTGTPAAYPVAILYRVRQTLEDFDSDAANIWGNSNVESPLSGRTITPGFGIGVTNGDGIAGNPLIEVGSGVSPIADAYASAFAATTHYENQQLRILTAYGLTDADGRLAVYLTANGATDGVELFTSVLAASTMGVYAGGVAAEAPFAYIESVTLNVCNLRAATTLGFAPAGTLLSLYVIGLKAF
jgi:hypothetical protein